jgi:hypothetical protein
MSPVVVAFVPDLMDRSRLAALGPRFAATVAQLGELVDAAGVEHCVVVVDLARPGGLAAAAEQVARGVRCIGVAPHVDAELRDAAVDAGVQVVARSRFFADPAQVLGSPNVQPPSR